MKHSLDGIDPKRLQQIAEEYEAGRGGVLTDDEVAETVGKRYGLTGYEVKQIKTKPD